MTIDRRTLLAAGLATLALPTYARAQNIPTVDAVYFDPDNPVLGNPKGDVTLVEFFDYQCPYCKKGHPDVLKAVADDGKVRLVMRDWPIFGDPSVYASRLVLAANQSGNYRKAQEALMKTPGKLTEGDIDKTLTAAGLNPKALDAEYRRDAERIDGLLSRNMELGEAFGFSGTPSFVVGTNLYFGVLDRSALKEAIAKARVG